MIFLSNNINNNMLKNTYSVLVFSAVCFTTYAQNDVRVIKASNGNSQVREINHTAVPVLEKRDPQAGNTKSETASQQPQQNANKNNGVKRCCMGNGNVQRRQIPKSK